VAFDDPILPTRGHDFSLSTFVHPLDCRSVKLKDMHTEKFTVKCTMRPVSVSVLSAVLTVELFARVCVRFSFGRSVKMARCLVFIYAKVVISDGENCHVRVSSFQIDVLSSTVRRAYIRFQTAETIILKYFIKCSS
jgi:hypothetical protein